jgi:hypothetical protein
MKPIRAWTILAAALAIAALPRPAATGAQKYTHPEFETLTSGHRTLAVLPFKVMIDKKNLPKNTTLEMIAAAEKEEAAEFQRQLYARFLQRSADGEYRVDFQDIDQTNALLARAGMHLDSLALYGRDSVAKVLGVDALVSGTISQARPTSTGTAMIQTALFGFSGSTQRVDINMTIHNGADAKLLWSWDHTDKGGIANSVEAMTKSLLKKVAGNFPYRKPKS